MATKNYAIHMNGVDAEYWKIADSANWDWATANAGTTGIWFRLDWNAFSFLTTDSPVYLWSREDAYGCWLEPGGTHLNSAEVVYYMNCTGGAKTWHTGYKVNVEQDYFIAITATESGADTSLVLYINGVSVATETWSARTMFADVATELFFGIDYGTTAGQYFKGNMTGFFNENATALTAANALTIWNSGQYDIDITEAAITDDSIGFEEGSTTTYDNALTAGLDGAGQATPTWVNALSPMDKKTNYQGKVWDFTGVGQTYGKPIVIDRITWSGDGIADNDNLKLADRDGNIVLNVWATADDTGRDIDMHGRLVNGLQTLAPALGKGIIEVHVR